MEINNISSDEESEALLLQLNRKSEAIYFKAECQHCLHGAFMTPLNLDLFAILWIADKYDAGSNASKDKTVWFVIALQIITRQIDKMLVN